MPDLRRERLKGLSLEEVEKRVPKKYMLQKYVGCKSFSSMDRKMAQWKSLPVNKIQKLRKEIYGISTDIKMINISGRNKISFNEFWDSDKLSFREKNWVLLRFNKRYTYEQIGQNYGITKDAVHKHFKRIFRLLSRNCTKEEILNNIFVPDTLDLDVGDIIH